jgi:hypothetical protein
VTSFDKLVAAARAGGFRHLFDLGRKNVMFHFRLWLDRRFDRQFGTDTSGRIELSELSIVGANRDRGVYFESTPTALFHFFMANAKVDHTRFTFIDLGSGKGRCMLLASNYPFKQILGVEFSRELHECATRNINIYRNSAQRCHALKSVMKDATEFDFPDGPLFVYAYNPFDEKLMSAVLGRLIDSMAEQPREVLLMYYNPRPWVMQQFKQLPVRAELKLPKDVTREVQRPASIYANFELHRGSGWKDSEKVTSSRGEEH